VTSAFKFLADGSISPFTGLRRPANGTWMSAAVEQEASWVFPCRARDLPYWVDAELWRVELEGPAPEARSRSPHPERGSLRELMTICSSQGVWRPTSTDTRLHGAVASTPSP